MENIQLHKKVNCATRKSAWYLKNVYVQIMRVTIGKICAYFRYCQVGSDTQYWLMETLNETGQNTEPTVNT